MKKPCCVIVMFMLLMQWAAAQTGAEKATRTELSGVTLYDADGGHLWNRLYAALFLRVDAAGKAYGPDSLDVLLWTETKQLVTEPSHGQALKVLDEFISSHGEKLIDSPLKRAVMQRDLWAAYDWTVRMGNIDNKTPLLAVNLRELRSRLALVIERVALSREQIEELPDNYAAAVASGKFAAEPAPDHPAPFLPAALFQTGSPWACLGSNSEAPLAIQHAVGCTYRSAFLVFVRLPEGRAALAAYLDIVKKSVPYVSDPAPPKTRFNLRDPMKRNPEMPQIPAGTMTALVRQMILIDNQGRPAATHLTESVQLRVYRDIVEDNSTFGEEHTQLFYEFLMDRKQLFADTSNSLRVTSTDESGFGFGPHTELTGFDPFDAAEPIHNPPQSRRRLQSCFMCHRMPGVFSINSISALFVYKNPSNLRLQLLNIATPVSEREAAVRYRESHGTMPSK